MGENVYLTNKINYKLEDLVARYGKHKEALANALMLLAMSDENLVKQAIEIITILDMKGGTSLEEVGTKW